MKKMNPASLAPVIQKMEDLFQIFNEKFFESTLSKPVITIAKGRKSSGYITLGWCSDKEVWKNGEEMYYEINVCPEFINRPIEEVCATLLHEMCHLYNALNKIPDTSRSSQYHNKKFKICAEKHGLNVEKDSARGFAITTLKPETLEFIKTLDLVKIDLHRIGAMEISDTGERGEGGEKIGKGEKQLKSSSTRKYKCPICGDSVRATKNVHVICGECNFRMVIV